MSPASFAGDHEGPDDNHSLPEEGDEHEVEQATPKRPRRTAAVVSQLQTNEMQLLYKRAKPPQPPQPPPLHASVLVAPVEPMNYELFFQNSLAPFINTTPSTSPMDDHTPDPPPCPPLPSPILHPSGAVTLLLR